MKQTDGGASNLSWDAAVRMHYQEIGPVFDAIFSDAEALGRLDAEIISRILPDGTKTILDCACGTGIQTTALARLGYSLVATDFACSMLAQARRKCSQRQLQVFFALADFRHLPFKSETFDALVCCGNSLTHLLSEADYEQALSEMFRVLRSGGLSVIEVRNYSKMQREGKTIELRRAEVGEEQTLLVVDVRDFGRRNDCLEVTTLFVARLRDKWHVTAYSVSYRVICVEALKRHFEKAGFEIVGNFDGITGDRFSYESDWCIALGLKPLLRGRHE